MKKLNPGCLLLLTLTLGLALGCGKKEVAAPGPQFNIKTNDLTTTEDGAPGFVIIRDDENSGPKYNIEASDLPSIEYIDKKLLCGPIVIPAKRALKNEVGFPSFKISEAEFHGLNQLPLRPTCTLQVIATNGGGSTVTKNNSVSFAFDKNPILKISRQFISQGFLKMRNEVALDSYEISNSLPYPIPFSLKPFRTAVIMGQCSAVGVLLPDFPKVRGPNEASPTRLQFDPPIIDLTGDSLVGYRFNVKPNSTLRVIIWGQVPNEWTSTPPCIPVSIAIKSVAEPAPSLLQSSDFEMTPQNSSYALPAIIQNAGRFPDISDHYSLNP